MIRLSPLRVVVAACALLAAIVLAAAAEIASRDFGAPLRVGVYALRHRHDEEGGVTLVTGMLKVAFSPSTNERRRAELLQAVGGSIYARQEVVDVGRLYFVRVSAREFGEMHALCNRLKAAPEVELAVPMLLYGPSQPDGRADAMTQM